MLTTKRKPATVGEILVEEFMQPMRLTQVVLAEAMGVQRKHVNELCNDRRNVTAATALILARVFGNSADFWLNAQRRRASQIRKPAAGISRRRLTALWRTPSSPGTPPKWRPSRPAQTWARRAGGRSPLREHQGAGDVRVDELRAGRRDHARPHRRQHERPAGAPRGQRKPRAGARQVPGGAASVRRDLAAAGLALTEPSSMIPSDDLIAYEAHCSRFHRDYQPKDETEK